MLSAKKIGFQLQRLHGDNLSLQKSCESNIAYENEDQKEQLMEALFSAWVPIVPTVHGILHQPMHDRCCLFHMASSVSLSALFRKCEVTRNQ